MDNNLTEQDFDEEGLSPEEISMLEEGLDDEGQTQASAQEAQDDAEENSQEAQNQAQEGQEATSRAENANDGQGGPANSANRPEGYVPHEALHQERAEHQATKAQLNQMQSQMAIIAERLADHRQQPETQQQEEVPDVNEDPMAFIEYQNRQIERLSAWQQNQENQAREQQQQQQQQQQQHDQQTAVFESVTQEYNAAAAADPTLEAAFSSLQNTIVEQGKAHGMVGQQLNQHVTNQARQIAMYARSNNMPIAGYIKTLATASGWDGKIPDKQGDNNGVENANAMIDKIVNTQKQNKSMKGAGGAGGQTTLEDLSKLSGAQLEDFIAKNPDAFDGLMGG